MKGEEKTVKRVKNNIKISYDTDVGIAQKEI